MSTGHFEDIDHDRSDGIAEAMRETAFSFETPASAVLHAGALAHARRHRHRSVAAGTLAAVATVGIAGAVVTQISPHDAASQSSSAGIAPGGSAAQSAASGNPTPFATASPAKPATSAELKALGKSVLDTALAALPAGSHPGGLAYGVQGSKFPSEKHLPVTPPTEILGAAYTAWNLGAGGAVNTSVSVEVRTQPLTCAKLTLSSGETCTTTSFAKGGKFLVHTSRKDPINQTGNYFFDYVWLRPDGTDIEVSQIAPAVSQFAWSADQVQALLALPTWDHTVTQLKAYTAAAGSTTAGH